MLGLATPGMAVWLSESDKPSRKLAYTWELVDVGTSLVGIHTGRTNAIVAEALSAGRIEAFAGYDRVRAEVRLGRSSRIDFLLESDEGTPCYLEVKSVTLRRDSDSAEFPDAVTARGAKHLDELAAAAGDGARAAMLFVVQRSDCRRLSVARDIDPGYARAFDRARALGVEMVCYGCNVGPEAIELGSRLPLAEEPVAAKGV